MIRSIICLALAFVCLVFACASTSSAQEKSYLRAGESILTVGDSISYQGAYQRYVGTVLNTLYPEAKITFDNVSRGGSDAGGMLGDLKKRLETGNPTATKPTIITAMFGVNDTRWNAEKIDDKTKTFVESLKKYQPLAVEAKADLLFLRETPFSHSKVAGDFETKLTAALQILHAAQDKYAAEAKIPVIDAFGAFNRHLAAAWQLDPKYEFTPDIIHPNSHGHIAIAGELLRALGAGLPLAEKDRGPLHLTVNPKVKITAKSVAAEIKPGGKIPLAIEVRNDEAKPIAGTLIVVLGKEKVSQAIEIPPGKSVTLDFEISTTKFDQRWEAMPLYMALVSKDLFAAEATFFNYSKVSPKVEITEPFFTMWGKQPKDPCPVKKVIATRTEKGMEITFHWNDKTPVGAIDGIKNRFGQTISKPLDLKSRGIQPCDAFEILFDLRPLSSTGRPTSEIDGNPDGVKRIAQFKRVKAGAFDLFETLESETGAIRHIGFSSDLRGPDEIHGLMFELDDRSQPLAFSLRVTDREKYANDFDGSGWVLGCDKLLGQEQISYFRIGPEAIFYRIGY